MAVRDRLFSFLNQVSDDTAAKPTIADNGASSDEPTSQDVSTTKPSPTDYVSSTTTLTSTTSDPEGN